MGLSNQLPSSRISQAGVVPNTAARPAAPYEGQVIYQQDTDAVLVWNGSAWYPNWNLPWGVLAYNQVTSNDLTITAEEVQITGSSFTAVSGRLYKVSYFEPQLYNSTTYMVSRLRLTNISGTQIQVSYPYIGGAVNVPNYLQWIGTLSGGVTNFVATLSSNSGTGQAYRASSEIAFLLVEDIGPA